MYAFWALATEDSNSHLGDDLRQFGMAFLEAKYTDAQRRVDPNNEGQVAARKKKGATAAKRRVLRLKLWSFCNLASTIGLTVMLCRCTGVFSAIFVFIPVAFAKYRMFHEDREEFNWWWKIKASFLEPFELMVYGYNSWFGIPMFLTEDLRTWATNLGSMSFLEAWCVWSCHLQ